MSLIVISILILLTTTLIFYTVFFLLSYYWHETKESYIIVPLFFTFQFFLAGSFVVALIAILQYVPTILKELT